MPKTKAKPAKKPAPKPPGVRAPAPPDPLRQMNGTVALDRIRPSPLNPRKTFPEESLAGLAASIEEIGLQQPLIVRPVPLTADFVNGKWVGLDHYELIDGERRYRALGIIAEKARGAATIVVPVSVRWLTDDQVLTAAIVANDQREDVRPSEQAAAYSRLAEGRTAEVVAGLVGKTVGFVRGLLRLARLPAWALAAVDAGTLSRATAELVARVPGGESRERAAACALLGFDTTHELGPDRAAWLAWCNGKPHGGSRVVAEPLSYRDTRRLVTTFFQKELKTAVFSKTALYIVDGVERPKCGECPSRAGNDPEAKAEGTRADTCLDPDCYRGKTEEYRRLELERAAKKYGAVPAEAGFNWLFADDPPKGWIDLEGKLGDCPDGLWEKLAGNRHDTRIIDALKGTDCPVTAAWGPGQKLRIIGRTAEVRKALTAAGVIPKPERKPPAWKRPPEPEDAQRAEAKAEQDITRCEKCKATFDAAGRSKCPSCSAAIAPPLITKVDEWEADERAVEIAAKVIGEYTEGCADDLRTIEASEPFPPLRMIARFLVRDCCEFGHERKRHVEAALPEVKDQNFEHAVKGMNSQQLIALSLRLVAGVVLDGEAGAAKGFGRELLDWAELDWPTLQQQARRELSGGLSADEKIAASAAAIGAT